MVRTPYQAVHRLCEHTVILWPRLVAAYYQKNLLKCRPHELLNLVYSWVIENYPSDKLEEWHEELTELLPWQDADSEAAIELESASFMAMAGKSG